jgi:hypothetical protein
MRQMKGRKSTATTEEQQMHEFMDDIAPRSPTLRIYRIDADGKKHEFLGCAQLEEFSLEDVRERFGSGTFLLRSVRSNGTFGPSRVVRIAPLCGESQ